MNDHHNLALTQRFVEQHMEDALRDAEEGRHSGPPQMHSNVGGLRFAGGMLMALLLSLMVKVKGM
jgi:hypothetical protein